MANGGDIKILDKLYINQNLICLIVSYGFMYFSKDWMQKCCWLQVLNGVFFLGSLLSVLHSLYYYSLEYKKKKEFKEESYRLRLKVRREVATKWLYEPNTLNEEKVKKRESVCDIDAMFKV